VIVNGQMHNAAGQLRVLLDTAAGATLVDSAVAARLQLPLGGAVTVSGTTGKTEAHFAAGVVLDVGALSVGPMRSVVMDLSAISKKLDQPVDVVLGRDHAAVEFDYRQQRVRFHAADANIGLGAGAVTLSLTTNAQGKYETLVQVEQAPAAPVHVDTGSSATVTVFKAFSETNHLLDGRAPISTRLTSGVVGSAVSRMATVKRLALGGVMLADVPAEFDQAASGTFASKTAAGNLGAGLLRRFHVLIDVPRSRLVLAPQVAVDAPFDRDRLGIQVERSGESLIVVHVADGSPAAAAQWRIGERITAINGRVVTREALSEWRAMSMGPSGSTVVLTSDDGRQRTVTLRNYY
jgi:hypothetical protein